MNSYRTLPKYLPRSARYILKTDGSFRDQTLVRLAGPHQDPWEETTQILNISLTGLSFLAPQDLSPIVGEMIRVEFEIPGGPTTACWAQVIQIRDMLVGVRFIKITSAQKKQLQQALQTKQQGDWKTRWGILRFLPLAFLLLWALSIWLLQKF